MQRYRSGYNGPDSKSGVHESVPWVRIPPAAPGAPGRMAGGSWRSGWDSNHVRTCRRHVHEPVRTPANSFIFFSPTKRKCRRILTRHIGDDSARLEKGNRESDCLFLVCTPCLRLPKSEPSEAGRFCFGDAYHSAGGSWRSGWDSNHVRTCRRHVHEPVRTPANSFYPCFRFFPQGTLNFSLDNPDKKAIMTSFIPTDGVKVILCRRILWYDQIRDHYVYRCPRGDVSCG